MSITTWWWIGFFVLLATELVTGTFYLLMAALGLAAAALLSYADTTLTQQLTVAAVVSSGAVAVWHMAKGRQRTRSADTSMDIGQTVTVDAWQADATTRVHYRGADWTAIAAAPDTPQTLGAHRIVAIDGSRLRITPM